MRRLFEFPHSHYCEIARWALALKQLEYRSSPILPGWHSYRIKKLAPQSSVPVLCDAGAVIQGSDEIVDYLEQQYPDTPLSDATPISVLKDFEGDVSAQVGVPLRQLCYAYLLADPAMVRFFFMHRSPWWSNLAFRALYPVLRARIRDVYDCTPEGAERAREALQQAMDGIDRQLGSREYFFDDRLTRADITFASLGAFFVLPEEYPVAWPAALREHPLMTWFAGFRDRPGYRHIVRTYQRHRPRDTNGLST